MPPEPAFTDDETLLPAIAQDAATGQVLMIAYMNRHAWLRTLETGQAVYYSRSRGRLWQKGEQSGHVQEVAEIYLDCDADAILLKVRQIGGAACHAGYRSCFFRRLEDSLIGDASDNPNRDAAAPGDFAPESGGRWRIVGERVFEPSDVYDPSRSQQKGQ